jgi:hypothetical protein
MRVPNPNPLADQFEYGQKKFLDELPYSEAQVPARQAGRPAAVQPQPQPVQAPPEVPEEHLRLMQNYVEARRAYDIASALANSDMPSGWASAMLASAETVLRSAAQRLRDETPFFDEEGGWPS